MEYIDLNTELGVHFLKLKFYLFMNKKFLLDQVLTIDSLLSD